ncbi:hypothetical protein ABZZ47_12345 [Streptomyces sp. NPDC006465]|uniref:hypothetical protein n=1 Tax=Streptomyces sp. NPDC006465 TaxID=3157174 RepID=UPI0033B72455
MTTTISRVGFVGLGGQGAPIAAAIGEHGFELHVWALRPASLSAVEKVPHTVHGSVAELGRPPNWSGCVCATTRISGMCWTATGCWPP